MPRPPASLFPSRSRAGSRPAHSPYEAAASPSAAIAAQHQQATRLHQQYLRLQARATEQLTHLLARPASTPAAVPHRDGVAVVRGIRYDEATLLTAVAGPMREVFGDWGVPDDEHLMKFRMPAPPFHFVTRLRELDGEPGGMRTGSWAVAEYDVPHDAWFFEENGTRTLPLAVLLEIVLQPCGLLAAHVGSARTSRRPRLLRLLDGDLEFRQGPPDRVTHLRTTVHLTDVQHWDDALVETFRIRCLADGAELLDGKATFGFFPPESFDPPTGMPVSEADRARLAAPYDAEPVHLLHRPARHFGRPLRLPGPRLLMLDRITGNWPDAGPAGLGRLRAEADVRADAWFFEAHFHGDPVQPGSLGLDAMSQLLQFHLIDQGIGTGLPTPRFRSWHPGQRLTWSHRGQVVPADGRVTVEMDILERTGDADGGSVTARAWLWVDGRRIYHAPLLRVSVGPGPASAAHTHTPETDPALPTPAVTEHLFDPAADTWVRDHCPTFTLPALPLMSMANLLARAAADYSARPVVALRDVQAHRWLPLSEPAALRLTCQGPADRPTISLSVWRESKVPALSRFAPVATATAGYELPARPARFAPLMDSRPVPDPYENGELFHGPGFHYLVSSRLAPEGSSGVLDPERGTVPPGLLHQGLLDGATHVIPHTSMWQWCPGIGRNTVAYPHRLATLHLYEPLPHTGLVEVEARFTGFDANDPQLPMIDVQLCNEDRVLADFRLITVLVTAEGLPEAPGHLRRAFLRDHQYVPGLLLSSLSEGGTTVLSAETVDRIDYLAGTVAAVYGLEPGPRSPGSTAVIAVKEHLARRLRTHPSRITVDAGHTAGWSQDDPGRPYPVHVTTAGEQVKVRDASTAAPTEEATA